MRVPTTAAADDRFTSARRTIGHAAAWLTDAERALLAGDLPRAAAAVLLAHHALDDAAADLDAEQVEQ